MDPEKGVEKVSILGDLMRDLGIDSNNRRFAFRAGWYCIVSLLICYVLGWLASMGFPSPFVRESEIQSVIASQIAMTNDLHQDRVERLDARILSLAASRCHSPEGSPARQTYTEQMEDVIRKYKLLTGEYPRVPECREISQNPSYNDRIPALLSDT